MKFNYATEVAAGACPGCGKPVILYHHVRLTTGEERRHLTTLDTIFCRECVERMNAPSVVQAFSPASIGRPECLPHSAH
jgi:hypothetical protein